jgi:hypothetical protein
MSGALKETKEKNASFIEVKNTRKRTAEWWVYNNNNTILFCIGRPPANDTFTKPVIDNVSELHQII